MIIDLSLTRKARLSEGMFFYWRVIDRSECQCSGREGEGQWSLLYNIDISSRRERKKASQLVWVSASCHLFENWTDRLSLGRFKALVSPESLSRPNFSPDTSSATNLSVCTQTRITWRRLFRSPKGERRTPVRKCERVYEKVTMAALGLAPNQCKQRK